MKDSYVTREEFRQLKYELMNELKEMLTPFQNEKRYVKSKEAKDLLDCSNGTLQNYRESGILHPKKVSGTYYYDMLELKNLLQQCN